MYSVQNVQKITTVTPELGKRHKRATNVTSLKWQQRNQDVMDCNYHLQTKFAKVMLLQVSVCLGGACVDTAEGVCNGFLALYTFFWFPEFSGYHQWQQESQ